MSLETDVANLVTKTESLISYFNGKKSGIDKAVADAISAVPNTSRTWYVDQVNGSDSNSGNVVGSPFKTIDKAMFSTPSAGMCTVMLLSDYEMAVSIPMRVNYLLIYGLNSVASGIRPKIKPRYIQNTEVNGSVTTQVSSFIFYNQQSNIELREVDISLPSPAGMSPQPNNGRICTLFKTNAGSNLPPLVGVQMQAVNVTMAPDFYGSLIGHAASAIVVQCVGCTFPTDFAGRYINSVPAGTDLKALTNVMTNLRAL